MPHSIRQFSVFLLLFCLTGFTVARPESYPFVSKALSYYRTERANSPDNKDLNGIDTSALSNTSGVPDFAKAYKVSWSIGLFLLEQGKHPQALDVFNSLRSHIEAQKSLNNEDKKRLSSLQNVIGAIYEETGLWNEALDHYMNSMQICNEIGFQAGKAKVFNNIGKLYFNRQDLKKAEELFRKAISINKELNIKSELFNNYNNLAGVYLLHKEPTKALDFALIALNQLNLNSDYYDQSIAYSNIGNLYQEMKNYPVALSYYRMAADLQEKHSFPLALIGSYMAIASVHETLHKNDSAEYYILRSLTLSEQIGNPSEKLKVMHDAARFYKAIGNYQLSSDYYADYVSLNDSLESLNSLTKMEQIQSVYEVVNKEKNNQILQQKINLQELAIQRQRIILLAAVIILLLLAYFFLNLLRNRKRERRTNEILASQTAALHAKEKEMLLEKEHNLELELDYKNRQLTAHALSLARYNELILRTSEELKMILTGLGTKDKERSIRIRNLLSTLQQYSSGNDWEEFRLYFQEVHQSFEKNLTAAFPDLSPNDKKICALLRLGLSSKDIAAITFREIRSVESARNRLRKKMGLAADVNIINFLSQF